MAIIRPHKYTTATGKRKCTAILVQFGFTATASFTRRSTAQDTNIVIDTICVSSWNRLLSFVSKQSPIAKTAKQNNVHPKIVINVVITFPFFLIFCIVWYFWIFLFFTIFYFIIWFFDTFFYFFFNFFWLGWSVSDFYSSIVE